MAQPPYQAGPGAWQPQGQPRHASSGPQGMYGNAQQPQPSYPLGPPYAQGGPPPPRRRRKSGCMAALLGVSGLLIAALVIAVGFVVVPKLRGDVRPSARGDRTASPEPGRDIAKGGGKLKTVERDGYDGLTGEEAEGIADPGPLVAKPGRSPRRYAGSPVISACTLLTFADLTKLGLLLHPNPLIGSYRRSYFDGQGNGPIEKGGLFVPSDPPNSCEYVLLPKSPVKISVFQESYTSSRAMDYSFDRYSTRPAIGDVTVRERKPSSSRVNETIDYLYYVLRLKNTVVQVDLSLQRGPRQAKLKRALLATIAGNLVERSADPAGIPSIAYNSPLITAKPAPACALIDAKDFQTLFHRPAAPFVGEEFGSAAGRTNFSIGTSIPDRNEYAYVYTRCERSTGHNYLTDRYKLQVEVISYMADAAPAHSIGFSRPLDGGQPLTRPAGEESYCVTRPYARSAGALVFRKGRFLVTLWMTEPDDVQRFDPRERCRRIASVAQRVAGRL